VHETLLCAFLLCTWTRTSRLLLTLPAPNFSPTRCSPSFGLNGGGVPAAIAASAAAGAATVRGLVLIEEGCRYDHAEAVMQCRTRCNSTTEPIALNIFALKGSSTNVRFQSQIGLTKVTRKRI